MFKTKGRKSSKIISSILALLMLLSIVPSTVFATEGENTASKIIYEEENKSLDKVDESNSPNKIAAISTRIASSDVCEINGTKFDTLAQAVEEAKDGETIKILKNIDLGETGVTIKGKSLTLDLNGQTVTSSVGAMQSTITIQSNHAFTVVDSSAGKLGTLTTLGKYGTALTSYAGDVTVKSGTVSATGEACTAISMLEGRLTVDGGTVLAEIENGDAISSSMDVIISSGTVMATGNNVNAISAVAYSTISSGNKEAATITINGGLISASGDNASAIKASPLNSYDSGYKGPILLTINGGTVSATAEQGKTIYVSGNKCKENAILTTVNGGTVLATGAKGTGIYSQGDFSTVLVKNGTVNSEGAQGSAIENMNNGKITISEKALVTSACTGEKGTITLNSVPNPATTILDIEGGTVSNTAKPTEGYSVYFEPTSVTSDNVTDYYKYATGATLGKVYPSKSVDENTYTVTFGNTDIPPQTVKKGDKVVRPADPISAGQTFAYWYQKVNNTRIKWNFDVDTVTSDITLYPSWISKPKPTPPSTGGSYSGGGTSTYTNHTPEIISGGKQSIFEKNNETAPFRIDRPFVNFLYVEAGKTVLVEGTHYTVKEGSTIVTLLPAYTNTLSVGTHTVRVEFIDGYAVLEFEVKPKATIKPVAPTAPVVTPPASNNPQTGDSWFAGLFF